MPPAEAKLWVRIRRERLGFKFRRQVPVGPYFLDFACVEAKLAVELDGGQHAEDAAQSHDARRDAFIERSGWAVLRFWNDDVFRRMDDVVSTIHAAAARPMGVLPAAGEAAAKPTMRR